MNFRHSISMMWLLLSGSRPMPLPTVRYRSSRRREISAYFRLPATGAYCPDMERLRQ